MAADRDEIAALVEVYRAGFATLDAIKLQSIWDRDYETIYCPIELAAPIRGWPAIEQYYRRVTHHLMRAHFMEIANLSIDILGDTAYAFLTFRFEGEVAGKSEPHKAEGRTTFIFRRKDGVWKGIHYHESATGSY